MLPEISPGWFGGLQNVIETTSVLEGLAPQEFWATTLIVPLLPVFELVILFVVEVPDQPFGNIQL